MWIRETALKWGLGAVAAAVVSCGPIEDLVDPPEGKTCYEDSDCVPNDCCGQAQTSVHRDDAPSCEGVVCEGACPQEQVQCGCGVPVCKDQRCGVAVQVGPGCE